MRETSIEHSQTTLPVEERRRSRRRSGRSKRGLIRFRSTVAVAAVTLVLASVYHFRSTDTPRAAGVDTKEILAANEPESRPVYPYSVIPGGATSASELRVRLEKDPMAARHYSGFQVERAVMVLARADQFSYVSYRAGGRIYWTSYRVRVKAGERLLTDGYSYARTRCGNRLSETPQQPTSKGEPVEEALLYLPPAVSNKLIRYPGELELPPSLALQQDELRLPNPPALGSNIQGAVRSYAPIVLTSRPVPLPSSGVPEPASMMLVPAAIAGLLWLQRKR